MTILTPTLPKVIRIESKLADHGGEKTPANLLPAILHDGLPTAVVQREVTSLATLGVDADLDIACYAEVKDPINELPALHSLCLGQICPNIKERSLQIVE